MKKKRFILFFIVLLLVFLLVVINPWGKIYSISSNFKVEDVGDIEKAKILDDDTIAIWDGDDLTFFDRRGKVRAQVNRKGEGQEAFFGDNRVMLYDPDLNQISIFRSNGKEDSTYDVQGEMFYVSEENGNIIIHIKNPQGETLYIGEGSQGLESIYSTDHHILDYEVKNSNDMVVTELALEANGYKSNLFQKRAQTLRVELQGEVAYHTGYLGSDPIVLSQELMTKVKGDQNIRREIPLINTFFIDSNSIYLLHNGILSKYDKNLDLVSNKSLGGFYTHLKKVNGILFSYGRSDLMGNIESTRTFHYKFPKEQEILDIGKRQVLCKTKTGIQVYDLKRELFTTGEHKNQGEKQ